MIRCQKCGRKTNPTEARVHVAIGETTISTITEVGDCPKCNIKTVGIHCRIEPITIPAASEAAVEGMEVKGNA